MLSHKQLRQHNDVSQSVLFDEFPQIPDTKTFQKSGNPAETLLRSLQILLQQIVSNKRNYDQYLSQSQQALAALPLTTAEFGQATMAIQNVQQYLQHNEMGAARYELGLLLRRLPRLLEAI